MPEAPAWHRPFTSLAFHGQTSPIIQDCEWNGYMVVRGGASVTLVGNTVIGDTVSIDGPGESTVRDNVFHRGSVSMSANASGVIEGNEFIGDLGQVGVDPGSVAEVRGNSFTGAADDAAIWVEDPNASAVVSGNTVTDSRIGVRITGGGTVTVEDNALDVTETGIAIDGTDPLITANTIESDGAGIVIGSGASPTIAANTVDADGYAIIVAQGSEPEIAHNVVCGNEGSIRLEGDSDPEVDGNEVCGDPAPE